MMTFDDMEATEKIRMYDKGAAIKHDITTSYAEIISLRFGDIVIPKIPSGEPLALECSHFIDCVSNGKPIRSDGIEGMRVVRVLEAGQRSLKNNGEPVNPQDF
jgi:predicted dehydrogenase